VPAGATILWAALESGLDYPLTIAASNSTGSEQ
jgi:hypothetical protein